MTFRLSLATHEYRWPRVSEQPILLARTRPRASVSPSSSSGEPRPVARNPQCISALAAVSDAHGSPSAPSAAPTAERGSLADPDVRLVGQHRHGRPAALVVGERGRKESDGVAVIRRGLVGSAGRSRRRRGPGLDSRGVRVRRDARGPTRRRRPRWPVTLIWTRDRSGTDYFQPRRGRDLARDRMVHPGDGVPRGIGSRSTEGWHRPTRDARSLGRRCLATRGRPGAARWPVDQGSCTGPRRTSERVTSP